MKVTAIQINQILNGKLEGNPNQEVFKLSKIEEGETGSITFLSNLKYKNFLYTTKASVVIISEDFVLEKAIEPTLIRVKDPYLAFTQLLEFYTQMRHSLKVGIEEPVLISKSAKIGQNVYIGAFTHIGDNVVIGDNVKIYSNVAIGENVTIGDNTLVHSSANLCADTQIGQGCIIHSGVVIGADGFGFAPQSDGTYKKIPQIGNVIIEDNVEIGANTTIDRATMGSTLIRKGTKIDNLVQIAHNVEVGENCVIAAQAGIAGSTKIGNNCVVGGQAGIAGHLTIENNVRIQAQSGVVKNLKSNQAVQGTPALGYIEYNKSYVVFKKLPQILRKVEELDKK